MTFIDIIDDMHTRYPEWSEVPVTVFDNSPYEEDYCFAGTLDELYRDTHSGSKKYSVQRHLHYYASATFDIDNNCIEFIICCPDNTECD